MFVYSSVLTSFHSEEDSTAKAGEGCINSKAMLAANAAPAALKKLLRDSSISHSFRLLSFPAVWAGLYGRIVSKPSGSTISKKDAILQNIDKRSIILNDSQLEITQNTR